MLKNQDNLTNLYFFSRTLRQAYEFGFEAPNMQIAMFIKQSQKHTEAFKDAIEDAKVWITPGKCFLHFKATTEVGVLKAVLRKSVFALIAISSCPESHTYRAKFLLIAHTY